MKRNDGKKVVRGPRHGFAKNKDPLYHIWAGIKSRCLNPKYPRYHRYGGRGIQICEEWRDSFLTFREWAVAAGYEPGLTIDRIENNGHYQPGNCEWLSRSRHSSKTNRDTKEKPIGESVLVINAKTASMIKHLLNAGFTSHEIAERFHVKRCVVANIWQGSTWKEVLPAIRKEQLPVFCE